MYIPSNIIVYVLAGFLAVTLFALWRLERRMGRLLVGTNRQSLEHSLVSVAKDLKDLKQFTKDMEQYLTTVETRLRKSVQSIETIRYNPFKGTGSGGNNSFSAAFLNEHGDGVLLTSMYARDRISMFAKPVKDFQSEYELSEEEIRSINACQKKLTTS